MSDDRILGFSEFLRYDAERREAFTSFDRKTIVSLFKRWGIPYPEDEVAFWKYIANAVMCMKDLPKNTYIKAADKIREVSIKSI